jgi:hypothetical protein
VLVAAFAVDAELLQPLADGGAGFPVFLREAKA